MSAATKNTEKQPMTPKRVIAIIVDVILWIFLAFSLLMTILALTAQSTSTGNPMLNGKLWVFVKSDSMEGPEGFYTGDLIFCRVLDDAEKFKLEEGDVISFYADLDLTDGKDEKELNTHRIVEVIGEGNNVQYQTRGDHEADNDIYTVQPGDVEAIWTETRIPFVGGMIGFMQTSTGFLVCIVLPLLVFFLYKLIMMIRTVIIMRGQNKPKLSESEEEEIKQRAIAEYLAKQAQAEQEKNTVEPQEEAKQEESEKQD